MGVRLRFNLRTALAVLLMASLASYYLLANPEAILASKLVRVMTETNAYHAPKWTQLSITPETSSREIITNRRVRVRCFVQDLRRSGLYDRPLPVVLSEMGFDADEPDSFFLAANFDEIWPEFREKTTTKDPNDSWFARRQRQGFWYELRRCFQLH